MGSSTRNKSVVETFMGKTFAIERIGADGDRERIRAWVKQLDGRVDAIGVGGTNLYVGAAGKRYAFKEMQELYATRQTPVVDGYGLKEVLEPRTIRLLQNEGIVDFRGKKTLMVNGVDRFGMSEALANAGARLRFADLAFALGVPIAVKSWRLHQALARMLLPVLVRMPFDWLYPTGSSEDLIVPKFESYYRWAEVIAGDFLYIKRHLPPPERRALEGKIVITNTVTAGDVPLLRERGVKLLVTTTPVLDGRSFATNVMEGVVVTLAGKRPSEMTTDDYERILTAWNARPRIEEL
ncbi:MAG: quinate 5-dehydrogenase [Armatimonadetes bacterium]|nr:quinate 5-dehydrogenase [Armatimonadota bacterium]